MIKVYNILYEGNYLIEELTKFNLSAIPKEPGTIELTLGTNFLQLESEDYSIEEYFELLEKDSGIVLLDGTILQIFYLININSNQIIKHSLIIYPPPFITTSDLDPDESILSLLEIEEKKELMCKSSKSITEMMEFSKIIYPRTFPIRFDYDSFRDETQHPASHCHLIHPENRIPLTQPLTPKVFFKIAIQLTNPYIWDQIKEKVEKVRDINKKYIPIYNSNYEHILSFVIK